jgi:hypothetical protein
MRFKKRPSRPTAQDVAARLLILKAAVVCTLMYPPREMLETISQSWTADERRNFVRKADANRDRWWGRVRRLGLWKSVSPQERDFARSTAVTISQRQHLDFSWRLESVQMLMWALGMLTEIPSYDAQADTELLKALPADTWSQFFKSAQLRPEPEIDRARKLAELWHWRSRTRQLVERGDVLEPLSSRTDQLRTRSTTSSGLPHKGHTRKETSRPVSTETSR